MSTAQDCWNTPAAVHERARDHLFEATSSRKYASEPLLPTASQIRIRNAAVSKQCEGGTVVGLSLFQNVCVCIHTYIQF